MLGTQSFSHTASQPKSTLVDTLVLGALFAAWYAANVYFNMYAAGGSTLLHCHTCPLSSYNKEVLKVFPFPTTCTTVQVRVAPPIPPKY